MNQEERRIAMNKTVWFDMDGTIADLYGVEGWLNDLRANNTRPYDTAKVMLNMSQFARLLNHVQRNGYRIGIISWTSKGGSDLYNGQVALAKMAWLYKHLKSVQWDEIKIVPYGTNKFNVCNGGILFDDEKNNRNVWGAHAYEPNDIIKVLKQLIKEKE